MSSQIVVILKKNLLTLLLKYQYKFKSYFLEIIKKKNLLKISSNLYY